MVPLDRALVSSYRLSVETISLFAAVLPQFAIQVFRGVTGTLTFIGCYVNKLETTFTCFGIAIGCRQYSQLPLATAVLLLLWSSAPWREKFSSSTVTLCWVSVQMSTKVTFRWHWWCHLWYWEFGALFNNLLAFWHLLLSDVIKFHRFAPIYRKKLCSLHK